MTKRVGSGSLRGSKVMLFDDAVALYGGTTLVPASLIHETWHQKSPDSVTVATYSFPDAVYCMGRAEEIEYESDKWEEDGDGFTYVHTFDSRPSVYGERGKGRAVATKNLLRVKDVNGAMAMPLLALTLKLTMYDGDKPRGYNFVSLPCPMCCSADRKTVIVLSQNREVGPLFVRGGDMVVTWRGIVK